MLNDKLITSNLLEALVGLQHRGSIQILTYIDTLFFLLTLYVCCTSTYETLTSFIEKNEEKLLQDKSEKGELDIRDYFDDYRNEDPESYKFALEDLHGLQRFFKICHKHNLHIYSCY